MISAHQPAYFPWLGLLHKIHSADLFIIFDCVSLENGSFVNRNRFRNPSAGISWLTLPVDRKTGRSKVGGSEKPFSELIRICDCLVTPKADWRRKHLEHIRHSYRRTPFFNTLFPSVEECLMRHEINADLTALCIDTTLLLARFMGIETPVMRSSQMNLCGAREHRVLDMVLKAGGSSFLFGALGRNYAEPDFFIKAGVQPLVQDFTLPESERELPPLSALDFLFRHGPDIQKAFSGGRILEL
jgi:hypothetical protein